MSFNSGKFTTYILTKTQAISILINLPCLSVCLSRYAFGRASTYGAETWNGGRVWRAGGGGTVNFSSRPDRSKVI